MPIQTYSSFQRLVKLCGATVPPDVLAALEPIRNDDQKVKDFGITLAIEMIKRITEQSDIKGMHFCTLNLEKSIQTVLEKLHWTDQGQFAHAPNGLIPVSHSYLQSSI